MTQTFYVVEDSTEELISYPPQTWDGTPSSPDVRVATASTGLPEVGSEDAATVDSVSASTNAAADEGARSLSFASDPGCIPGRLYRLHHASTGPVVVKVLSTGATVYLAHALPCDVPSGATLTGLAVSHALTTSETSTSGRGLAIWRATIGGVVRSWEQAFRVVPRAFSQRLTSPQLQTYLREWPRLRPEHDITDQDSIDSAYEWVLSDLEASGYRVDRINSIEKLNLAVVRQLLFRAREALDGPAAEATLKAEERYHREIEKAKAGADWWYDRDDDEDLSEDVRDHPAPEEIPWLTR